MKSWPRDDVSGLIYATVAVGATVAGISDVASATGAAATRSVAVTIWDRGRRTIHFCSTILADVTGLMTLVAGLASSVQGPSIWCSAVTRDVALVG